MVRIGTRQLVPGPIAECSGRNPPYLSIVVEFGIFTHYILRLREELSDLRKHVARVGEKVRAAGGLCGLFRAGRRVVAQADDAAEAGVLVAADACGVAVARLLE